MKYLINLVREFCVISVCILISGFWVPMFIGSSSSIKDLGLLVAIGWAISFFVVYGFNRNSIKPFIENLAENIGRYIYTRLVYNFTSKPKKPRKYDTMSRKQLIEELEWFGDRWFTATRRLEQVLSPDAYRKYEEEAEREARQMKGWRSAEYG